MGLMGLLLLPQATNGVFEILQDAFFLFDERGLSRVYKLSSKILRVMARSFGYFPLCAITTIKLLEFSDQTRNHRMRRPKPKVDRIGPGEHLQRGCILLSLAEICETQQLKSIHVLGVGRNFVNVFHCRYNKYRCYRGLKRDQKKKPMSHGDFQ